MMFRILRLVVGTCAVSTLLACGSSEDSESGAGGSSGSPTGGSSGGGAGGTAGSGTGGGASTADAGGSSGGAGGSSGGAGGSSSGGAGGSAGGSGGSGGVSCNGLAFVASCRVSAAGCIEYYGSAWTVDTVMSGCESGGGNGTSSTSKCDTTGNVGACASGIGANSCTLGYSFPPISPTLAEQVCGGTFHPA